ncbi:MAG: hypothetical protein AAF596_00085 [Planctomycetota bacterium]
MKGAIMQIDLPTEIIEQAKSLATPGVDAAAAVAEVVAKAADVQRAEQDVVAAVQEGIDAYERGDYQPIEEFGKELQTKYGIKLPEE